MFSYEWLLLERINCSHNHDNNNCGVRIIYLIDVYAKPAIGLRLDLFAWFASSSEHLGFAIGFSRTCAAESNGKSLLEARAVGHPDSLLVQDFHCSPRLDMAVMSSWAMIESCLADVLSLSMLLRI